MSERTIELSGPPEQAAAQLWAHLQEKTMLNGEKLPKFDSPEQAADVYLEHLTLEEVKKIVKALITTLQKMRTEREDIFEKNSALEDAVGKLIKEKIYLQRQLASAINSMTEQQKRMAVKYDQLTERQSQAKASSQKDLEQKQSTEQTLEASPQ
jgi:hypothetical protein